MRRLQVGVLALAGLLQVAAAAAEAGPTTTVIAPLPVPTGDQPKLTCADFRKSIVDGGWSSTRAINIPILTLASGASVARGKASGLDLVAILEKDCAARRPS